jgi:Protein of unknown function (DUF2800)
MKFYDHSAYASRHAFLSASKYHWIRYDEDKLYETFLSAMDAVLGTRLHAFAAEAIKLKMRMPDTTATINSYINDAIGFRMTPEVTLMASENAFGTADAVSFYDNTLRIHDLKNGVTPAKMDQLMVYACYFLIEYRFKPNEIKIILRIYQNDEIIEYVPELDELVHIIDKINTFDELINKWKGQINS